MLGKAMLTTAASYHRWATERILDGAGRLQDAEYRATGAQGGRNVHDTLFHMLRVDHVWRTVCERPGQPFTPLAPRTIPIWPRSAQPGPARPGRCPRSSPA